MMTNGASYSRYEYEIVRQVDGVGFGRRPVAQAYLESAREQLIFFGQRRGIVDADAAGVTVVDSPVFADEALNEVRSIEMQLAGSDEPLSLRFGTGLFQSLWQKTTLELLEAKQLDESEAIRLRVFSREGNNDRLVKSENGRSGIVRQPLPLLEGTLNQLLPHARAVGPVSDEDYPVFITDSAFDLAHEIVWERNRERGVWLVGNLYRQRRPHEIFCVVTTVFEARGTKHERFSIDFSTETFTHVEQQLALSRKRLGRKHDVLLGFQHTHPFLPSVLDGMEACPTCSLRPTCTLTSSFFSQRDQAFHAAMFGSAPYAVEIVLGLTPREEFDVKMFCCDGGRFRERGFYRIAELPENMLSQGEVR
jgi:hypothetical protein